MRFRPPRSLAVLSALFLTLPLLGLLAVPASAQAPAFRVLVFSKTAGFRHDAIPAAVAAIQQLGAEHGFAVDATEDAAAFTDANLDQYDAVIFALTTGDVLDGAQQAAFERYVRAGGGYVGIHSASDTEYDWPFYGELVGAYFDSHPPGTPTATVEVADRSHPSTSHLPVRWTRVDEWYNFQANPRGRVHVLATLDEGSYGGGTMGADHPIAWCHDYQGGRSWYTALGHAAASYSEPAFLQHLLGGIQTAAGAAAADCGATIETNFEKVALDTNTLNPFELDVAPDGRVFFIERGGDLKVWKPETQRTVLAGHIDVFTGNEDGLLGLALDPDFAENGWVYLYYSPAGTTPVQHLARYTVNGDTLDPDSRRVLLEIPTQRDECCHSAGSLAFGPDGNLYVSTGDNTNPFASDGRAPIDERPGRSAWDAQKSASNTNDLRGKILRIHPEPDGTYTIPEGNLFPEDATHQGEIYTMGHRNPFRISVDPETGWVYVGDVGPDASAPDPARGPAGHDEWNQIRSAGNYGWPYCIADNKPYVDYDFATGQSGAAFDCSAPTNDSPNNTGAEDLPAARPAWIWYPYGASAEFPELGTGGRTAMAGPVYHFDPDLDSDVKLPAYYDDTLFIYEWSRNWIKEVKLDGEGNVLQINPFMPGTTFLRPMDLELGPDGALYLLEWGTEFGGGNTDSGLYKIQYVRGSRSPVAKATATPDAGPVPLTVQFSSEGSGDPDPGDTISFAWDFTSDGTVDATDPNPTFTYTTPGNYTARLTVTDASGKTGVANVPIAAGNTRPAVTVTAPPAGGFIDFGEEGRFTISVTDPEDGTVDCGRVEWAVYLGHDAGGNLHTHGPFHQGTGCEGTFEAVGDETGHGAADNLFTVFEASYTDGGAPGVGPLTTTKQALLHPKRKQAEHWTAMQGVQTETTTDPEGGGLNVGWIDDGDWIAFEPVNLTGIDGLAYRTASAGAGGTVEVRVDAPDGPVISTATMPVTGGWQNWTTVTAPVTDPGGSHELFFVFKKLPDGGATSLFNINFIDFTGRGLSLNQRPLVRVTATPTSGEAPLTVRFEATATDPDGGGPIALTWSFGDGGTAEGPSATHTYASPGTYTATLTATDAQGASSRASVTIQVTQPPDPGLCEQVRSDEFNGEALDRGRWTRIVREDPAGYSVSGGWLRLQAEPGDIYGGTASAKNLILQPAPAGAWSATARITFNPTENYHQAGLMLYGDDQNYAKLDLLWSGGRRIEFIREADGSPRNEAADSVAVPTGFPETFYLRLTSDGSNLTAAFSADGEVFTPVGRPASLEGISDPHVGPFAFSNAAATVPEARFDWVRVQPDQPREPASGPDDEFDGDALDGCRWNALVRPDLTHLRVTGGHLEIETQPGDIYGGDNSGPRNLVLQRAPAGDWQAVTKVTAPLAEQYQQAGLMAYGDDGNYVKLDLVADNAPGSPLARRFELRSEAGDTVQDPQPNAPVAADAGTTWYLRLTKRGTTYTGEFSADGETWTALDQPVTNAAITQPKVGVFAIGTIQTAPVTVRFDWFRLVDATPPETALTLDPAEPDGEGGWYRTPVTVALAATDAGSGVATTEYQLDGGDWTAYAGPFQVRADGSHALAYRSTDRAGNVEEARTATLKLDATAPVLAAGGLEHGALYGDSRAVTLTYEAADATSGLAGVRATLDGEAVASGTTLKLYQLPLGLHELELHATDRAGNAVTETRTFFVATSFEDLSRLLDQFRQERRLGTGAYAQLRARLIAARLAVALDRDRQAIAQLQAFASLAGDARRVGDAEVRAVLVRDAGAMLERLGGAPGAQARAANRGRPLDGAGRLPGDPATFAAGEAARQH